MLLRLFTFFYLVFGTVCATTMKNSAIPLEVVSDIMSRPFAPVTPVTVTAACRSDSQQYLDALSAKTSWALNMFDASAKIPSGILTGHTQLLGNYDQCVMIKTESESTDKLIRGQLCSPVISFIVADQNDTQEELAAAPGSSFMWALCVPASCTHEDVATALRHRLSPLDDVHNVQVDVAVSDHNCVTAEDYATFDAATTAFICLLSLIAVLVVLSTAFDIAQNNSPSLKQGRFATFLSFSLILNCKRLFNTKSNKEDISCIHGLRVISLCWVVFGHSCYMIAANPLLNASQVFGYASDWTAMIVMNATLSTDTFLLISGVLLSYIFMRKMSKLRSFNLGLFYLHRFTRLTPVYAMLIFFYSTLLVYIGSGPLWKQWVEKDNKACQLHWWTNLLYINNYVGFETPCMGHTWYLAVDMQLFWISPLFLYPLLRRPRLGKLASIAGIIGTISAPFIVTYVNRLPGAMLYLTSDADVTKVFSWIYIRTYNRAGPYIIGIALGYHLYNTKDTAKETKTSKVYVVLGWMMSASCCLAVLYGVYGMYQATHVYDVVEASFYAGFHRPVWALGVAWVVYACVRGYGGPVNSILSCRIFIPLSRLSYAAYLCHYMVLIYNAGTMRTPGYVDAYPMFRNYISNLVSVFALAAIISLLIEIPFTNLETFLIRSRAGSKESKESKETDSMKTDLSMKSISELDSKEFVKDIPTLEGISVIKDLSTENFTERTESRNNSNSMYTMYNNVGYS